MGPLNDAMAALETERQGDIKYPIAGARLGEYFDYMEQRGIAPNIASFVGATTVRDPRARRGRCRPDARAAGARCRTLVRLAMNDGAMGVGSSLIYAPGLLCRDARTDRAGDRVGAVRRHVHQPYPQRERPIARGGRRADRHRARVGRPGRNLSSEAGRPRQLGQARRRHRPGRGGARVGRADHRRHVHLHRRRDRARRGDAAVGAGGRL